MTCISRGIYAETEEFYIRTLHIFSIFQIPLHAFGTYIVIRKTPSSMEGVKYTMLLLHLGSGYLDLMLSVLTLPYIIYPTFSATVNGIFAYIELPAQVIGYISFNAIFLLACCLIMFFEERFNRLVRSNTRSYLTTRIVNHTVNFAFVFLMSCPIVLNLPDQEAGRAQDFLDYPCLPSSFLQSPTYYKATTNKLYTVGPLVAVLFLSIPQVLYFAIRTGMKLFETKAQSRKTSDMQKKFFFSLCIQVAIPLVIIVFPCFYIQVTAIIGYVDLLFANISMLLITFHGTFSTIAMLSIHKPYRIAVFQFFRLYKSTPTTPLFVAKTSSG